MWGTDIEVTCSEIGAEFLGTFLIVFFGNGVGGARQISGVVIGAWEAGIVWGLAVLAGILASATVSGAHLNPAVTFGMAAGGKLPLWKVPHYLMAQVLGGICGAGIIYSFFYPTIAEYESLHNIIRGEEGSYMSSSVFSCALNPKISAIHGLYIEWFIAFILLLIICYVNDKDASGPVGYGPFFPALMVAFGVALLDTCFGPLTGGCLNPARDLGPRIVTAMFGWSSSAFPGESANPWWPFICGPILGGITGVLFWENIGCRMFRIAASHKEKLSSLTCVALSSRDEFASEKTL